MTKEQLKKILRWLAQEENRAALRLTAGQLRFLLRHYRLRQLRGEVTFGFEDPYTVGRLLGLLAVFYPAYGETFSVTPVFDRQVLEGAFQAKGHIRLIHVVTVLVRLMMNRQVRTQVLALLRE